MDGPSDLALVRPICADATEATALATKYPPLSLSTEESQSMRVGDRIFAVGSPFGLLNAMSAGVVSGLDRTGAELHASHDSRIRYLQTDLHLFPGNSGGPVFNQHGRVIGISTVRAVNDGLCFAIQLGSIQRILEQMLTAGRVRRAWLGKQTFR